MNAPAKVNLSLHITGRRDDGLHEIDSIVGFTDVCDRIMVVRSDSVRISVRGPESDHVGTHNDNLAYRAAIWLRARQEVTEGADIVLNKHLPVAAGLGGGSADAAATLKACQKLWSVTLEDSFHPSLLAADLGADVPVCRYGQAAWIRGIGESLTPVSPWPETWLVLVNPRQHLSTAEVFRQFSGPFANPEDHTLAQLDWGRSARDFAEVLRSSENSLTETASILAPSIKDVLSALNNLPACLLSRMSGSGPTCFGLFAQERDAIEAASELTESRPNWWVRSSPLLSTTG